MVSHHLLPLISYLGKAGKICSSSTLAPPWPSGFLQCQLELLGSQGQPLLPLTQQGLHALHMVPTHGIEQWRPSILSGAGATSTTFTGFSYHPAPSNLMWFLLSFFSVPSLVCHLAGLAPPLGLSFDVPLPGRPP